MPPPTRSTLQLCAACAATTVLLAAAGSASGADQGSVQIVAIAPAFCRLTAAPHASAARLCNTASDVQVSVQVSNLDRAALQLDGADILVSANGVATLSPQQLAALSDLRVVNGRPAEPAAVVELTITPQ